MKKSKLSLITILLPALFFMGASSMVYAAGGYYGGGYGRLHLEVSNRSAKPHTITLTGPKWSKKFNAPTWRITTITDYESAPAWFFTDTRYRWTVELAVENEPGKECIFSIHFTTNFMTKVTISSTDVRSKQRTGMHSTCWVEKAKEQNGVFYTTLRIEEK